MESPPLGATPPQPPPETPPEQAAPPPPPGPPPQQAAPPPPPQYGAPPPPPPPYGGGAPGGGYGVAPPPAPVGWAPPPTQQAGPAPGMVYAGFWIRFVSLVIDWIGLGIIRVIGNALFVKTDAGVVTAGGWWLALWYVIPLVYYVVTWVKVGETYGHRVFNIEVLREEDGQRLDWGRGILRLVGYIVAAIPIGIGLIWAGFDPRKQGWHDKIARTIVVRRTT